ncbi:MAG: L-2-hydroxyglutarate oxidase [Bacteroidetes bacterium]|nr:L-2-hydroxyglutarate oxidase [Bacteroidota bacterium]
MPYHVVIVGGGIVGLATAYQSLKANPNLKLLLLEKENQLAKHQTGNNSGVIHSGLYYKPGGLKATNCIRGYHMLLDFLQKEQIPYELCGKLVVATQGQELPMLDTLFNRGIENGLQGLEKLSPNQIREIEPHCAGISGIKVPQTGIVDYKAVCEKLALRIREMGGEIALGEKVHAIRSQAQGLMVETVTATHETKFLVNCAGLYSDKVAGMTQRPEAKIIPFRGEYYELKHDKSHLVKHLIYPVPDPNFPFLGVHFTRMIGGGVEAGPNAVLAFAREGYSKSKIDLSELLETLTYPGFLRVAAKYWQTGFGEMYRSFSKSAFTKALQRLIPEIQESDLMPGGAGVRAQACDPQGGLLDDFKIQETERVINVINAPSPAATSSLSIGATISSMLAHKQ